MSNPNNSTINKRTIFKYVLILMFLPIYVFYYIWFKSKLDKKKKIQYSVISFVIFIVIGMVGNYNESQNLVKANELNQKAELLISQGKTDEALNLLNESVKISKSDKNKAVKLQKDINTLFSDSSLKQFYLEMSGEDYDNLVEGKFYKKYSDDENINSGLLIKLKENSNKRADYITERLEQQEKDEKKAKEKARENARWNVILAVKRYIRESMNDPKSYEEVSTNIWDYNDYMIVNHTFRGKNAFNATIKNSYKFKVYLDGDNVTKVEVVESY